MSHNGTVCTFTAVAIHCEIICVLIVNNIFFFIIIIYLLLLLFVCWLVGWFYLKKKIGWFCFVVLFRGFFLLGFLLLFFQYFLYKFFFFNG